MRSATYYKKRQIAAEHQYNSQKVAKFINYLMLHGKKQTAMSIAYQALALAAKTTKSEPMAMFDQAVENASPVLEVKPRRIGGATYLVPMEVKASRRMSLAMKAIINAARAKQGKPMKDFLAEELVAAFNNEGAAVARKDELHKLAEANKAFAHYAKF